MSSSNASSSSTSPKFDVHGYSGCPLQVISAPSFDAVQAIVYGLSETLSNNEEQITANNTQETKTTTSKYFVMKLSSKESYNARLKKQAEKQQFFHREMMMVKNKNSNKNVLENSATANNSLFIHIPPILYMEKEIAEVARSFLLDEESTGKIADLIVIHKNSNNNNNNNNNTSQEIKKLIEKWKSASSSSSSSKISSSAITGSNNLSSNNTLSAVIMPYVHHTDCLRFLCTADFQRIKRFEDHLCYFFDWQVQNCEMKKLPLTVIVDKLQDLKKVCSRPDSILQSLIIDDVNEKEDKKKSTMSHGCLKILNALLQNLFSETMPEIANLEIPMGFCHGDLTLSNILVQESTNDKLVFIDFLDSFLESPLSDMCKINQDLSHGWTIRMLATANHSKKEQEEKENTANGHHQQETKQSSSSSDSTVDPVRLFILFERMMKKIVLEPFGREVWFQKLFRPLCVVSQMRVLQYSTDETVARYLWKTIEEEKNLCDPNLWNV